MTRKVAVSAFAALALVAGGSTAAWAAGNGSVERGDRGLPQRSLVGDSLNKPCLGVGNVGAQAIADLINNGTGTQAIDLGDKCTHAASEADAAWSKDLDEIPESHHG